VPRLIEIGLALLKGDTVPPYNYVEHRAVTADRAKSMLAAQSATADAGAGVEQKTTAAKTATKRAHQAAD
jgi:ribose transport system substrate-binding protein